MNRPFKDAVGELQSRFEFGSDANEGVVLMAELDLAVEPMLGNVRAEDRALCNVYNVRKTYLRENQLWTSPLEFFVQTHC